MPQLIVRNIEENVVRNLRLRAVANGVSMEEEHRRILRGVLLEENIPARSFSKFLLDIPRASENEPPEFFARPRDLPRTIDL